VSPEMLKNSKYDAKADIWSLGCIVYEIITFKHVYSGAYSSDSLFEQIIKGKPPRIPKGQIYDVKLRPIVTLMNSMLEKNVAKRYTAKKILESEVCRRPEGDVSIEYEVDGVSRIQGRVFISH